MALIKKWNRMKEVTKTINLLQEGDILSSGDGPVQVLEDEQFDQWDRCVKVVYLLGTGSKPRGTVDYLDLCWEPTLMTKRDVDDWLKEFD